MRALRAAVLVLLAAGAAAGDGDTPKPPRPPPSPPNGPQEPAKPDAPPGPAIPAPRLVGPRLRSDPERKKALSRYGGTSATEAAVAAGLDWLARHQDADGSWDADGFDARCAEGGRQCDGRGRGQHGEEMPCPFDGPISAFATLAFLGAGHLPDAPDDPYADVVKRAVASLGVGGNDGWALPVATEALAELEAMERKGLRTEDVRRNVEALAGRRDEDGAWGYWGRGSDVPYASLVVPALVAARDAGVDPPSDLGKGVDAWLSSLEEAKGKLGYRIDGRQFGYTPTLSNAFAAIALRELTETGTSGPRHRAHLALLASEPPKWEISFREKDVPGRGKVQVQMGYLSVYWWYYGTLGTFQRGGDSWTQWFGALKTALVPKQRKDGCAKGSWDPEGWYEKRTGGRVFATALAVLMLEQPYRHRRLGK